MSWLVSKHARTLTKLLFLVVVATLFRLREWKSVPVFGDMEWFFTSAKLALITGILPTLGITASITWLHQGALWTYLLLLPQALALPAQAFTLIGGILAIILAYFAAGPVAAVIMALLPFAITQSLTAYHTSLIPLFFFTAYLCLLRKKWFLSGLFLGFLYQLHLLTFIYWPLFIYLLIKQQGKLKHFSLGFVFGIIPFILAGPIQLGGIFIWAAKQLVTGFTGVSSGISTAYLAVLLPLAILLLGWMLKWLNAYRRGSDPKRGG